MSSDPIVASHPTEFFRELVKSAMESRHVSSPEEVEFYLVNLLAGHLRTPPELLSRPLALTYLEAEVGAPGTRFEKYRRVGDTALFLAGMFGECLEKSLVPPSYYVNLGSLAYARTANTCVRQLREMFAALANRFSDLVGVLGEISARDLFGTDQDTYRIYRRWVISRSSADLDALVRRGVIPGDPTNAAKLRH
jgi:hypothetical protein